jgi:membrane protein
MKRRLLFLIDLFKTTGERWSDIEGSRRGAAFSYYATFSIFPLMLLALTMVGFVVGDDAQARERLLSAVAGPGSPVRDMLEKTLDAMQESRSGRGLSAVIGIATLLLGASGAFVELDATLNRIWSVPARKSIGIMGTVQDLARERLSGLAIVAGVGVTLLASLVMSSVLGAIAAKARAQLDAPLTLALLRTTELALSIALLSATFTAAFHFIPRTRPPWRDVAPGAILTTVMLTLLKAVFASYLSRLTSYSAYGIAGGVLALLTWIYLSSQIIFFGAQFTRVHSEKLGSLAADSERELRGPSSTPSPAAEE